MVFPNLLRAFRSGYARCGWRATIRRSRHISTNRDQTGPPKAPVTAESNRASRILSRLPRSFQPYTNRLREAPVSHIAAFLVLHEVTAVVPLVGFFALFHYTNSAPVAAVSGYCGTYVAEGATRFECYFKRKGWFGFVKQDGKEADAAQAAESTTALERWKTDPRYRAVVEVALAYAITKVLLPVRIAASIWATPWFAGVLVRLRSLVRV